MPITIGDQLVSSELRQYLAGAKALFAKGKGDERHPKYCKNCGGLGSTVHFVVSAGPFEYQPADRKVEYTTGPIDHKWYQGKWVELQCPCCNGDGYNPDYHPGPIHKGALNAASIFKPVPAIEVHEDYTDI